MLAATTNKAQGHHTDFLSDNCHLLVSWHEKFNVCCFRIAKNVVLSTEKRTPTIIGNKT